MSLATGCRVVRGPDWKWTDQDGGEGHVGTVVVVGRSRSVSSPDKTVVVQWDGGTRTNYRCGYQNAFDLCLYDNGPAGVKHPDVSCSHCKMQNIEGMRWQCDDCIDYNLCTLCYMNDKHSLDHVFSRCEAPGKPSISVGRRLGQQKIQSTGTFAGARVMRGPDWDWGNQDGGLGAVGQVIDVRGWDQESFRSVVSVKWKEGATNVYRLGHKGKVDVTCVVFSSGGHYYKDHLPKLGETLGSAVNPGSTTILTSSPFEIGDQVRVLLPVPMLKALQEGHGGWHMKMEEVIGLVGTVHRVTERGDIRVRYPTYNNRWTFHPGALTKFHDFHVGDKAKVLSDASVVKRLQAGHGEWAPEMTEAIGKVGKVFDVYTDGDVRLSIVGKLWTFNPAVLVKESLNTPLSPAPTYGQQQSSKRQQQQHRFQQQNQQKQQQRKGQQQQPLQQASSENFSDQPISSLLEKLRIRSNSDVVAKLINEAGLGHLQQVKTLLCTHPNLVNVEECGRTALQVSSYQGYSEIVKFLLEFGADPNHQDEEGDTALHYAASTNRAPAAAVLLGGGADCNQVNKNKCAPLHVAVNKGHVDMVKTLLGGTCDVNVQDSYGDSALYDAVSKNFGEIVRLLVNATGANFNLKNKRGFNILHHCAFKGNGMAASLILSKAPGLANSKKDDGFSSLHLAALNGHYGVARALVEEARCDVNIRNSRMQTPLLLAVDKSHSSIVELLLDNRADVNCQDDVGSTPLHLVVMYHSLKYGATSGQKPPEDDKTFIITRLLLLHGANVRLQNQHSKTALQLCRDPKLKELLAAHGSLAPGSTPSSESRDSAAPVGSPASSQDPPQAVAAVSVPDAPPSCRTCDNVADSRFDPCGHVVCCYSCAPFFKKCFHCKGVVHSVTKIVEETRECVVCFDAPASVTFEPCGHKVACADCAARMKKCIECQTRITEKKSGARLDEISDSHLDTMESLQTKMREIEGAIKCVICLDNDRNVAFLCGHGTCAECASELDICPMCRKPIQKKITLFI